MHADTIPRKRPSRLFQKEQLKKRNRTTGCQAATPLLLLLRLTHTCIQSAIKPGVRGQEQDHPPTQNIQPKEGGLSSGGL